MKNHKKIIIVLSSILMIILILGIGTSANAQKQDLDDFSQFDVNNTVSEYYNNSSNLKITFHSDLE